MEERRNADKLYSELEEIHNKIYKNLIEGGNEKERERLIERFHRVKEEFMEKHPDNTAPYEKAILLHVDLEELDRAEEVLKNAVSRFPASDVIKAFQVCFKVIKENYEEEKRHLDEGETLGDELYFRVELTVQYWKRLREYEKCKKEFPSDFLVETEIDGITVKGEIVFLAPNDITVEIKTPYEGVSSGLHVPHFAMASKEQWLMIDGKITEKGRKVALNTLEEIYRACEVFSKNVDEIRVKREELLKLAKDKYDFESKYHDYLSEKFNIWGVNMKKKLDERFLNIKPNP